MQVNFCIAEAQEFCNFLLWLVGTEGTAGMIGTPGTTPSSAVGNSAVSTLKPVPVCPTDSSFLLSSPALSSHLRETSKVQRGFLPVLCLETLSRSSAGSGGGGDLVSFVSLPSATTALCSQVSRNILSSLSSPQVGT